MSFDTASEGGAPNRFDSPFASGHRARYENYGIALSGLISVAMRERFGTHPVLIKKVSVDRRYLCAQLPFVPSARLRAESSPNL